MKKKVLFAAVALVAFASCSNDDFVGEANTSPNVTTGSPTEAIVFSSGANTITRADFSGSAAATMLGNNFVVEGIKWDGSGTQTVVFDHYNVNYKAGTAHTTTSNTDGWEYVAQTKHAAATISAQTIKYWDYAKSQYDFIAYSKGTATAVYTSAAYDEDANVYITNITPGTMGNQATGAYTVKGKADNLAKLYIADLKTAYNPDDYQTTVQFQFRSLSAKVRVALYETVPGYSVKDVKFYTDASTVATDGNAHLYTTGSDVFNETGTYTVYYPTTGSSNVGKTDYNKAHLAFTPDGTSGTSKVKSFGKFAASTADATLNNTFATAEGTEAAGDYLGRTSNHATYAGKNTASGNENYYTIVIPNENGAVLNLKVDYTLISTDGSGETIKVTAATAQVPAAYTSWKSGYAYTYIFKISQNSNGQTGSGTTPAGLYPITFDAVVTETEEHVQETITTVANPSITTYAKGQVVTDNNEYKTGNNIYVVVNDPNSPGDVLELLTSGDEITAKLYTVTIEAGAAQTINEATIANALKNGTYNSSAKTWTVTDINGKKLVVTDQSGLDKISQIPATDAPDGNAITVDGAKFTPATVGYYVFQYRPIKTNATYYTAEQAADYNTEHSLSPGDAGYKSEGSLKTAATYQPADKCYYKIIKVVE